MKAYFFLFIFLLASCDTRKEKEVMVLQNIQHMHNLKKLASVYFDVSRIWLVKAEQYSSMTDLFFNEEDSKGLIFLRYTMEALDSAKHYFKLYKEYTANYEKDSVDLFIQLNKESVEKKRDLFLAFEP